MCGLAARHANGNAQGGNSTVERMIREGNCSSGLIIFFPHATRTITIFFFLKRGDSDAHLLPCSKTAFFGGEASV